MKIKFYPKNKLVQEVIPPPTNVPVPSWFKSIPNYVNNDKLIVENGHSNLSVKSCVPFLDSFSTGYVFTLWCDVQVRYLDSDTPRLTWATLDPTIAPLVSRDDAHLPIDDSFFPFTFSWSSHWGIETPKGYSCLFTHPLNRTDLPFITTSGIIDTDRWGTWGNQPFALKKGWEGILPSGTPIIQFIPFKREHWKSEIEKDLHKGEQGVFENIRKASSIRGYYKKKYWTRKRYE